MSDLEPIVFVVDDDPSVRRSLGRLIRSAGFTVESFPSAQDFLERPRPDISGCLVLDIHMPGVSGLDLQEELAAAEVNLPVIFLTGYGTVPASVRAMKAGAVDFLEKPVDDRALVDAIHQAVERNRRARREQAEIREIERRIELLSPREREVFSLLLTGMLNKQIASELGTTEKTIKVHRGRVMEKMQASSMAELVRLAAKLRIR
ncbi:MAG TPA: response regulator [Syntrophobacteria bacterium]|nr:response regulator [Syntrophobacteria bacterium]